MIYESYERLNAERKCFVPLPNGNVIINGTLMNNDFVPQSEKEVAVRGFNGDFSSCRSFWNSHDTNAAYSGNLAYAGCEAYLNVDVSTDSPVFGYPTAQDPKTGDILFSVNLGAASVSDNLLSGDIIKERVTTGTTPNSRIVDVTDKYWYVLASYNTAPYGGYLYAVDRETLVRTNVKNVNTQNVFCYGTCPQILHRDNDILVVSNQNVIFAVNKANNSVTDITNLAGTTAIQTPATATYYACPLSPKVNGWHIRCNPFVTQAAGNTYSMCALKLDLDGYKYQYISNIQMESVADKCDETATKQSHFTGATFQGQTYYHMIKIDDHTLCAVKMFNPISGQFTAYNNKQFPSYAIFSVEYDENDQSVPPKFKLENAQFFDKSYTCVPILISPTKIAMCLPNQGIDVFSYDAENKEWVKTTSFDCNGLSSACYFNGYIWWYNNVTSEINYEIEGESYTIEESYDKDIYMADENGEASGKYYVSIRDGENVRVEKQLKLEPMTGSFTFADGSTSKTITTSATKDTEVPIKIVSAPGKVIMKVTLVS